VNACAGDWEAGIDSQQGCYPLGGYPGTGEIKPYKTGEFMLDTTGASYSSLNVVYKTDTGASRLCYIDRSVLGNLTSRIKVVLNWQNDAGNIACRLDQS
jgi:hypothetical protein